MWTTTKWAVLTWLKLTLGLILGCLVTRWLAGPGWATVAVVIALAIEWWSVKALGREWDFEARLSWWWTR